MTFFSFFFFFPDACFGKLINNLCYLDELSQVSRHAVASEAILLGQGLHLFHLRVYLCSKESFAMFQIPFSPICYKFAKLPFIS